MNQKEQFYIAYIQGKEAKDRGYERNSLYAKLLTEQYWYAGYDNINFDDFYSFERESRREIRSSLGYSRIGLGNI